MVNPLKKLKSVKTKIVASIVVVLAMTGVMGVVGIIEVGGIAGTTETMFRDHTLPLEDLGLIQAAVNRVRIDGLRIYISDTRAEWEAEKADIEKEVKLIEELGAEYEAQMTTDAGRRAFDAFIESWDTYLRALSEELVPLVESGDLVQAKKMIDETLGPTAEKVAGQLEKLFDIEVAGADEALREAHASASRARTITLAILVAVLALGLGLGPYLARTVANPLKKAADALVKVAEGDLTQRLDVDSRDEAGQMAEALNGSLAATQQVLRSIRESSTTLASSSEELSATSSQMGASAEETSTQSSAVSAAAEQVSQNVQSVASSSEQMSISIREIASSTNEAATVASNAVAVTQSTNATVTKLGESSAEIGEVIKVITSIAEQTNLLALNATIEAARAGEAGTGFAVVANEVKALAKETAKATEDIGGKIVAIQGDAAAAVSAIGEINEVITKINDIQGTIASAVEEQAVTTNEISRSAGEAASGANDIAASIGGVAQAARDTSTGAASTQTAARSLAHLAEELGRLVGQFRVDHDPGSGHIGHTRPQNMTGAEVSAFGSHFESEMVGAGDGMPE